VTCTGDRYQHAAAPHRELRVVRERDRVVVFAPDHHGRRRVVERLGPVRTKGGEVPEQDGLPAPLKVPEPDGDHPVVPAIGEAAARHLFQKIRGVGPHPVEHGVGNGDAEAGRHQHQRVEFDAAGDLERHHRAQ
jgi:hypothetical protein